MQARILLAAIAKDESAYLPEWIFHHLNLGIAGIMVYVNNTTDNSIDILDKISSKHPNVNYKIVDGIDTSTDPYFENHVTQNMRLLNPLQGNAYADIYRKTDVEQYDYILYLDIDEFFLPSKSLNEIVGQNKTKRAVITFQWFCLTGDNKPFQTVDKNLKGELDQYGKCMVPTGAKDFAMESPHLGLIGNDKSFFCRDALAKPCNIIRITEMP